MWKFSDLTARTVFFIAGVVVLILAAAFTVRSCDKRHSQAAQSRLDAAQGGAQANSAADAVNTVAASGEAQAASEELTRQNEKEIRDAKGSDAAVDPAVRDAGIRSLCKRSAYRDSERCKLLKPHP
jgi:ABC-type protease/lipase transport system fused ATPase/permease subunit